uniref:ARMET C-terminal domain-containing protein n=1 Tax=Haptolina brevifila TaxID=156173 RepID=A0A6U7I8W4_9EUKA|mmetsp:Transcript_57148/g.113499  ORF Transcript_57148/g.113499 Transcript_57148/m.113499 type:complete len:196 (+) Transcript_57148:102-689(+)|eukprot:CAMPEP_0174694490 /NCGR_PEP_ID=MMETSP1094-20130205/1072_1 /TAXON_ID=156173 /ORGANISM="Chrysochromulina brevifilum, Strain UTEX LB 985" /LENGTH=195 /DNA_ID=CAMNT_0015890745 /DNA_START=101 /DNA_END=688 /DNA_ORIENTATION=+
MPRSAAPFVLLASLLTVLAEDEVVDCAAMKTKQLRTFLSERGLQCEGCAEKADFVKMCEANIDAPKVQKEPPAAAKASPDKEQSIEDLLASMKGMPGMEGIKMFSADDLKGMNPEQMGSTFGGKERKARDYRQELVNFYTRYDLTDKIDGIDAALTKWAGREDKMMSALYKKYDAEIQAYWDKEDAKNEGQKEEL